MKRHGLHLSLLLLALSLFSRAAAQGGPDPIRVVDPVCYWFPDERPYSYQRVTLENVLSRPVGFEWEASSFEGSDYAFPSGRLEPGERRTWHLPIPSAGHGVRFRLQSGRQSASFTDITHSQVLGIDPIARWPSDLERENYSNILPGTRSGTREIHYVEPAQAPDNWLCYSPFRMVVMGYSTFRALDAGARNALMEYVRMGGYLTLHSAEKAQKERLQSGWIEYRTDHPVKTRTVATEWTGRNPEWLRFYHNMNRATMRWFPYRVENPGGRIGGLVIATLFFILAGPVNYLYFRRRGRIRMLLVSLPAISIAFCLLIGVYFIAAQGFRRKGGTVSVTLLDESRAAAMTIAHHCVISGLYPIGGFRFPIDTAFVPMDNQLRRNPPNHRIAITPSMQILRSGLFEPGVPFHYATAKPFDTREKLIYDASQHTVLNTFESDIDALLLFDEGKTYAAGKIPSQGSATLEAKAVNVPVLDYLSKESGDMKDNGRKYLKHAMQGLVSEALAQPGIHYVAILKTPFESANPGVGMSNPGGFHILVGTVKPTR